MLSVCKFAALSLFKYVHDSYKLSHRDIKISDIISEFMWLNQAALRAAALDIYGVRYHDIYKKLYIRGHQREAVKNVIIITLDVYGRTSYHEA